MTGPHQLASTRPTGRNLAVVGGGMVAHRLVEALLDSDAERTREVQPFCGEPMARYDRVAPTSYFAGATPDLVLGKTDLDADSRVTVHLGSAVIAIDTAGTHPEPYLRVRGPDRDLGQQVALFRIAAPDGSEFVHAVSRRDAFADANVIAGGVVYVHPAITTAKVA